MAKVLILGGTGNISEPIVKGLLARGDEVILFNRGTNNLFKDVFTHTGNRDSLDDKIAVAARGPFDCVIDMIGFTPKHAVDDITAFAGKTEQFIFCSTFNVFSQPVPGLPISGNGPRNPAKSFEYAYDKAEMERIYEKAAADGAFHLTIIRCSATYREDGLPLPLIGGHGNEASIPTLTRMLQGKPIIAPGDGTSVWSVTFHDDTANAFVNAVQNEKAYDKAYTLASEESLSWEQYYRIAAKSWGAPEPAFIHVSSDLVSRCIPGDKTFWLKEAFHYHCFFDITDAKRDLNFRTKTTWEAGSLLQYEWHQAHKDLVLRDDPEYEYFINMYQAMENKLVDMCLQFRNEG